MIAYVNKEEENAEGKKRKVMKVTIKVSGLRQKRSKHSGTKITWDMFHNIYPMYSDIKIKEETTAVLLITKMSNHKDMSKVSKKTVNSHENHQNEFNFQVRTIVPPDLHQI